MHEATCHGQQAQRPSRCPRRRRWPDPRSSRPPKKGTAPSKSSAAATMVADGSPGHHHPRDPRPDRCLDMCFSSLVLRTDSLAIGGSRADCEHAILNKRIAQQQAVVGLKCLRPVQPTRVVIQGRNMLDADGGSLLVPAYGSDSPNVRAWGEPLDSGDGDGGY